MIPDRPIVEIRNFDELSDEICILRFCETCDERAFNCLVDRYSSSIRRILYTVLHGPVEDLEDVEQEVLLSLYQSLPKFSFRSSFRTWLFRMCRNKAVDHIRKSKRKTERDEKLFHSHSSVNYQTPESLYIYDSTRRDVMKAVMALDEKERTLILMKDVENLSLSEISIIFGRPVGTIKSRLHRARLQAAEKMIQGGVV